MDTLMTTKFDSMKDSTTTPTQCTDSQNVRVLDVTCPKCHQKITVRVNDPYGSRIYYSCPCGFSNAMERGL